MRWSLVISRHHFSGFIVTAVFYLLEPTLGVLYSALAVDATYETIQSFAVRSLVHCVVSCDINSSCSAVAYDKFDRSCESVRRDSVSWTNPTKSIYVSTENKSKTYFVLSFLVS